MDESTKARVLLLLESPIADLTVREAAFLAIVVDRFEEEVLALVPEIAVLLEEPGA